MGTWQDIETAPKDGRLVMLWLKSWAGEIGGVSTVDITNPAFGAWRGGRSDYPGADWWSIEGGDAYAAWGQATHWMPLPDAPVPA